MNYAEGIETLLIHGLDDEIHAAEVAYIARLDCGATSDEEARDRSLAMLREVLTRQLMTIGDMEDGEFRAWPSSTEESLRRVAADWQPPGRRIFPGALLWLINTPLGDEIVRAALARKNPGATPRRPRS